jgi:hypothetical protein
VTTWIKNRELVNGLWKNAEWTQEQVRLWHGELFALDQWALEQALKAVAIKYTSDVPKLKWVLAEYKAIKSEHRNELQRGQTKEAKEMESEIARQEIDEQNNLIRDRMTTTSAEVLLAAVDNVRQKTGIQIHLDTDVHKWSNMALGFINAELERMDAAESVE